MGEQVLYFVESLPTLLIVAFVSVAIDLVLKEIALVQQLQRVKIVNEISKIGLGI